jgi:hypothetical protein
LSTWPLPTTPTRMWLKVICRPFCTSSALS